MALLASLPLTGTAGSTNTGILAQNGTAKYGTGGTVLTPSSLNYSPANFAYAGIGDRTDLDVYCDFTVPANEFYFALTARAQSNPSGYYPDGYSLNFGGDQSYALAWTKNGGSQTIIDYAYYDPTPGLVYTARLRVVGTSIQSKVWLKSNPEPSVWDLSYTDANVTAAGDAGWQVVDGATDVVGVTVANLRIYDAAGVPPAPHKPGNPGLVDALSPFGGVKSNAATPPPATVVSNHRTFNSIVIQTFDTPAAVGTVRSAYTSMGYFTPGQKDTSNYGRYDPDQVLSVHDGMLDWNMHTGIPSAEAQSNGAPSTATPLVATVLPDNYTSITYGRAAVRYKTEATTGVGYKFVPMFWPVDDDWNKGEIDFVEFDIAPGARTRPANATPGTLGQASNGGPIFRPDGNMYAPDDALSDWHIGVCEWTPEGIFFYHDGILLATIEASRVPTTPMRVELQGETFIGEGAPSASAVAHIYVDWVATYQMASGIAPNNTAASGYGNNYGNSYGD